LPGDEVPSIGGAFFSFYLSVVRFLLPGLCLVFMNLTNLNQKIDSNYSLLTLFLCRNSDM